VKCDYLIVGAGFYGSVLAERIANDLGGRVLVLDKRDHIGGNCYSYKENETGIEWHKYGTHIFHTSSQKAWDYINQFTSFNGYFHQVLTTHKGHVYQMPINLETINSFYNLNLTPTEAEAFIQKEIEKEGITIPADLEEQAVSLIGRPLYEAFIKGYTKKQWAKDPKDLPASIITRLPVRYNYDEAYFKNARWQGIPLEGYTKIFENLLASTKIEVKLNCDYFKHRDAFDVKVKTIYTGPIDRFFDYSLGKLEWRTVEFEKEVLDLNDYQGTSVMNYADTDVAYIRIHEPKHLHPERSSAENKTLIFKETSRTGEDEPFYPINTKTNHDIFAQYKELAEQRDDVIFGGRLGNYAYYDMDKTILAALKCYEEKVSPRKDSVCLQ